MENYFKIPYFVTGSDLTQEFIPSDICPANEDDELFNLAISGNKGNFWMFQHLSPFNTCKLKPDFFFKKIIVSTADQQVEEHLGIADNDDVPFYQSTEQGN